MVLLWNLGFQEMRPNGLKGNKTKQLSRGYQFLAMTHVLAAAGPTKGPEMQNSNTARRRQEKQLQRNNSQGLHMSF